MQSTFFKNARIITETGLCNGAILIRDGIFCDVSATPDISDDACLTIDLDGQILAPGFIDVQVNGGGGFLFNDDPSVATIKKIASAHRAFGTTSMAPTLISDDLEKVAQAVNAADAAIEQGIPGILGVHIEGPFLNTLKRGIHDASKIRRLTDDAVAILTSAKHAIVVVTIAPECVSLEQIRQLSEGGVRICAGHTNATYDETKAALDAGIIGFTHLFNAMSPMQSRHPGVVPAALESNAWCGLIVDGHHVHPSMLQLAYRAKTDGRFMLVTDAMPVVGAEQDFFCLGDKKISVKDGACLSEDGTLAGAAITMNDALINATTLMNVTLSEAVNMASINPAKFLGLDQATGSIAAGKRADFVVMSEELRVLETWVGGERMHAEKRLA